MAFMIPEYYAAHEDGDMLSFDGELIPDFARPESLHGLTERLKFGYFARLSAPGYMDCTEWDGPFATEGEARAYIRDTWDVDDETGEPIEDDEPFDDFTGSPDGTPKGQ